MGSKIDNLFYGRIINHLLQIEKQTNRPLRAKPRNWTHRCPLFIYAPEYDSHHRCFQGCQDSHVKYQSHNFEIHTFVIHDEKDRIRWQSLSEATQNLYLAKIAKWRKTHRRQVI